MKFYSFKFRWRTLSLVQLIMQIELEMSMMGELRYFLGLQIHKTKDEIFINQSKYCKGLLKKFGMHNAKEMSTSCYLFKDEECKSVEESEYIASYDQISSLSH